MGKCTETMRRERKCNCGETEMEKAKNQDEKEEAKKSRKSAFFFLNHIEQSLPEMPS